MQVSRPTPGHRAGTPPPAPRALGTVRPAATTPPRAVLFDFHDTLAELVGGTDHAVAAEVGVPVDDLRAAWASVDRLHLRAMRARGEWPGDPATMWYRLYGLLYEALGRADGEAEVRAVADRLIGRFRAVTSYRAYLEARPVLEVLKQAGFAVGLVSNSDFDLGPVLDHVGLGGLVDVAVPAFAHGVEKPDPRAFELATDRLGVDAADCWFVGDHPEFDAVASDVLGMTAVLVDREGRHAQAGWPFPRIADLTPLPGMLGLGPGPAPSRGSAPALDG